MAIIFAMPAAALTVSHNTPAKIANTRNKPDSKRMDFIVARKVPQHRKDFNRGFSPQSQGSVQSR